MENAVSTGPHFELLPSTLDGLAQQCPLVYVDDNLEDQLLFENAVRQIRVPFRIKQFFTGESAFDFLKGAGTQPGQGTFPSAALLLLDYDLGSMKGSDLVRLLRSTPSLARLPVIIYSGSGPTGAVADCYQAGADHFVSKCLSPERLKLFLKLLYSAATKIPQDFSELMQLKEYCPPLAVPSSALRSSSA